MAGQGASARGEPDAAPEHAPVVLVALILVAAVANLNLAVANVALPDIGKAFDSSQTTLDMIAIGYSLGLAASVLYLGALGDRYGRKLMLILGVGLSIPACILAAWAPTDGVLVFARIMGGVSAGMAYPTTLALITALWSGQPRTRAIALWSAIGGAISALGPLTAGWLLGHFWWGSVFLITLPLAAVALVMAIRFVPAHVNEATDPVDNLGGILSVVMVAGLVLAINFAPVPDLDTAAIGLGVIAAAALIGFVIRQRRARFPLYDLDVASRRIFWVAALAGIIVFGSLMGAMFIGQQFLQNVLGYSPLEAGAAILPAVVFMVIAAPRSAKLIETHGARFTLLLGYLFCLLGFLTMLLLWEDGERVLAGRSGLRVRRPRRRPGRHPGLAFTHRFGARATGGNGVGDRRPPARPRRGDHAVDPRRAAGGGVRDRVHQADRRVTERQRRQQQRRGAAHEVVLERGQHREPVPAVREADYHRGEDFVRRRRQLGLQRGDHRDPHRRGPGVLHVP